jgi:hypothetical protein
MWRKGDDMNLVVASYGWGIRFFWYIVVAICVLGLIGAVASQRWLAIPVLLAFGGFVYAVRRWVLWMFANSPNYGNRD